VLVVVGWLAWSVVTTGGCELCVEREVRKGERQQRIVISIRQWGLTLR